MTRASSSPSASRGPGGALPTYFRRPPPLLVFVAVLAAVAAASLMLPLPVGCSLTPQEGETHRRGASGLFVRPIKQQLIPLSLADLDAGRGRRIYRDSRDFAPRAADISPSFRLTFLVIGAAYYLKPPSSAPTAEKRLLLDFKNGRSRGSSSAIATWSASTEMCSWAGVSCHADSGSLRDLCDAPIHRL